MLRISIRTSHPRLPLYWPTKEPFNVYRCEKLYTLELQSISSLDHLARAHYSLNAQLSTALLPDDIADNLFIQLISLRFVRIVSNKI